MRNNNDMIRTLKLSVKPISNDERDIVMQYRRQTSSCVRYIYNRLREDPSLKEVDFRAMRDKINHTELIDSWFFQSCIYKAIGMFKSVKALQGKESKTNYKMIFGGKANFIKRAQSKMSYKEWKEKSLEAVYSVGDGLKKGNRKFQICSDLKHFIFKPRRGVKIMLELAGYGKNRRYQLQHLYEAQEACSVPLTYSFDGNVIQISYSPVSVFRKNKVETIENRVFAVDLNPNYVGWSVTDWKDSNDYTIIDTGVISIKELNDAEFALKHKHYAPNSPKRMHLVNKRRYEVIQISDKLESLCKHYRCSLFGIEDLNIESSDKQRGKKYNRLCNNMWCSNLMFDQIEKRCKLDGIVFLSVIAAFSSFNGNFLFRKHKLPDMVLASVELGRRAYEFYNQYVIKTKPVIKNIVFPQIEQFLKEYIESLKEFNVWQDESAHQAGDDRLSLKAVYYMLKKSKVRYRLSIDSLRTGSSRLFSCNSLVSVLSY